MNLLETCEYESTIGKRNWEKNLGLEIQHRTRFIITDSGCLPLYRQVAGFNEHQMIYTLKLFKILRYYIDRLV